MATRVLSLQAYLAYSRSGAAFSGPWRDKLPERPEGPVIWMHGAPLEQGRGLVNLCKRLQLQHPEAAVFLTGDMPETGGLPGMQHCALPPERQSDCDAFIKALRPDVLLWSATRLRPALLNAARDSGTHMIGLAQTDPWHCAAPRWLPDPTLATLDLFDNLHCASESQMRILRRGGVNPDLLQRFAPLLECGPPLPCTEGAQEELAGLLTGRPIWLAARCRADEAGDILRAHRRASRLAHRLLLILAPQEEREYPAIAEMAKGAQMRVCHWDSGDMPDENTQVILLETPDELGLWFRLAPLAFLGGSLMPGHGGSDPYEAASLGTAILYGANVGNYLQAYSRLVTAGAARIVRDMDSLSAAVSHLVAPDQAASMAHAGWEVVSSAADVTDAVIAEIAERLDALAATPGGAQV